ncbi:MAG: CCA tRNA nucleotidyltransferase [Natronomonas sp.]
MELEVVLERVRERVVPDETERAELAAVVDDLRSRAERAISDLPVEADVLLVGSTARGTWISGERDVDLFVRFPPDLSREKLERYGREVGYSVLPEGHEEFAEHPYVKGEYRGFDVDCVPCFAVESAGDIRTAVDRTPFHNAYLVDRIEPLSDDVRLAKAFLDAIGAYGSNLRTRGFSGFLTELLVDEYGGFTNLLEAAADWITPVELDPRSHGRTSFDDPLVVIDPTDPERNVAAVCSETNVARLQHYSRAFLAEPTESMFEPWHPDPLSASDVRQRIETRETTPVALRFPTPDVVDDQLYPQLDKSLSSIERTLDRAGFDPIRSTRFADETAVLLVECGIAERPAIERHEGPPVGVRDHAENFLDAYESTDVTGPFIESDRYVVEKERNHRTPAAHLEDVLSDISLGPAVRTAVESNVDMLVDSELASLTDEFGSHLARYFNPRP